MPTNDGNPKRLLTKRGFVTFCGIWYLIPYCAVQSDQNYWDQGFADDVIILIKGFFFLTSDVLIDQTCHLLACYWKNLELETERCVLDLPFGGVTSYDICCRTFVVKEGNATK
jgi:hypothetical protein